MFAVYILYSQAFDKIYIGQTAGIVRRFHAHNHFAKKGWTIRFRPWKVIYVDFFESRKLAIDREKHLKSGQGRQWVWAKIHQQLDSAGFISLPLPAGRRLRRTAFDPAPRYR